MSDDKPPVPDDHPIQELWHNNELLRSVAGTIELAEESDAYAARELLALFCRQVHSHKRQLTLMDPKHPIQKIIDPGLLDYVCECFSQILAGEKPSVALNLTTGKKGRPKRTADQIEKAARIGYHVVVCLREGMTENEAFYAATLKFHVSESTARDAYRDFMQL